MAGNPRTVEEVFKDFSGRREGMLKALTTGVDSFYQQCDPEKENLCLYGHPNESWEVNLPAEEVPPELPEPALGINFARDGMVKKDWLSLVAVHSDAWLIAVAFFFGAQFNKNERKRLFSMMNELPTVFDVVSGRVEKAKEKQSSNATISSTANKAGKAKNSRAAPEAPPTKPAKVAKRESPPPEEDEDEEEEDEEDHGDTLCGICEGPYGANEFWIGCDICQKWYHGKCVKVTPAKAEHIKHYKCPNCNKRR
eukprot:TRINITY_DN2594_c0_g1_i1.p1 TRINITY_DN2594_c0_g1~~TRINITY_DN2594_c0_g1_i1.p1  ORF type:complete len:253 (+),score=41.57 TRINITY_DN2594_c0_g1_i1:356-1114(+)